VRRLRVSDAVGAMVGLFAPLLDDVLGVLLPAVAKFSPLMSGGSDDNTFRVFAVVEWDVDGDVLEAVAAENVDDGDVRGACGDEGDGDVKDCNVLAIGGTRGVDTGDGCVTAMRLLIDETPAGALEEVEETEDRGEPSGNAVLVSGANTTDDEALAWG
jgi:hypothetical protein